MVTVFDEPSSEVDDFVPLRLRASAPLRSFSKYVTLMAD